VIPPQQRKSIAISGLEEWKPKARRATAFVPSRGRRRSAPASRGLAIVTGSPPAARPTPRHVPTRPDFDRDPVLLAFDAADVNPADTEQLLGQRGNSHGDPCCSAWFGDQAEELKSPRASLSAILAKKVPAWVWRRGQGSPILGSEQRLSSENAIFAVQNVMRAK
jgi:hypothetical protein